METPTAVPVRKRIHSLDILRGLVIVLMAIDHIRDYFAMTPQSPELMDPLQPSWFFTRWITHFCAPVFVFLAGTAAFLYGKKTNDRAALSRFLISRGLWLILIELLVINSSWTLSLPPLVGFVFVQVIWAIGWSMILLAGLIWLPQRLVAIGALVLIAGHNALDGIQPESWGAFDWLWKFLHMGFSWVPLGEHFGVLVAYPLIPWIAIMPLGYVFGNVMNWEQARRFDFIRKLGLGLILLFILLRLSNWYGDPRPWSVQDTALDTIMSFLNTVKYPPSLLYLLMTLGPALLLLIPFEKMQGRVAEFFITFGRVPFFFYVLHFPILMLTAVGYHYIRYGIYLNLFTAGRDDVPEAYSPQLWIVYLVFFLFLPPMYFLCKWYWRYKSTHDYWWLRYL
jgi:uncharacterized membrane protein